MIRKVKNSDIGRIAEIIVYNNRINYFPIFQDIEYSFREFNVLSVAEKFRNNMDFMQHTYVYEDMVIKGFIYVMHQEVRKLYVDSFFQNQGIGRQLLQFAIREKEAQHLWALEKNTKALRFYERYGFYQDGQKKYEEGTSIFLVHMIYAGNERPLDAEKE
ncbi:MAG: GNAT family N-acetyltransferase [Lachnospiraceae bacterium]|jgi:GNAT superfamily N-acetyltransferase|nr:GNAT family N-acetyltransferase [Lachnospiraceae bacterium]